MIRRFPRGWFWTALVTAVSLVVGGWLVKSWNADFIVTLSDNNYLDGAAATIDPNIGQYYSRENILIDSITLTPKSSIANL